MTWADVYIAGFVATALCGFRNCWGLLEDADLSLVGGVLLGVFVMGFGWPAWLLGMLYLAVRA